MRRLAALAALLALPLVGCPGDPPHPVAPPPPPSDGGKTAPGTTPPAAPAAPPKPFDRATARTLWRLCKVGDWATYHIEKARVKRSEWRTVGKAAVAGRKDEDREYRALRTADDLLVVGAGGPAGGFGAIIPPWYGKKSLAVTMAIDA